MDADLNNILDNILGFSAIQITRMTSEGMTDANEIAGTPKDDLLECFSHASRLNAQKKAKLTAFKAWIDEQTSIVGTGNVDVTEFDQQTMDYWRRQMSRSDKSKEKSDTTSSTIDVGKFDGNTDKWIKAKDQFLTKLMQIKNRKGLPLYYVLREPDQETDFRNEHGELGAKIFDAPHMGEIYDEDALAVLQKVRDWTYSGSAKAYIENEANVQTAWANLMQQYEGTDSVTRQIKKANDALAKLHYAGEKMKFTFQDYCSRHIEHNRVLSKFNDNQSGETQVNRFFEGIRDNARKQEWLTVRGQVMSDPATRNHLIRAIEKTKQVLSDLNVNLTPNIRGQRRIGSVNQNSNYRSWRGRGRGGRGGRGRGRGGGRYGGRGRENSQGRGDGKYYIDQSKLDMMTPKERMIWFTGREALERQEREAQTNDDPDQHRQQGGAASMPPPAREGEEELPPPPEGLEPPTRSAASRFAATPCDQNRTAKRVRYSRQIDAIISSVRRIGRAHYKPKTPTDYTKRARIEIDSRADTFCGGSTCKMDCETGQIVDVSGFHSDLGTLEGVQVGRLITAYDLPSGETIILVFNEGLYFGDKMQDSLLPPAQVWDHNITCDITPKSKSNGKSIFGIYSPHDDQYLSFNLHGCIAYLPSRLPTPDEEANCRRVVLTSERTWKPYSDKFKEAEDAADAHFKAPFQGMFRPSTTVDGDDLHLEGQRAVISSVTTTPSLLELEHDQIHISSTRTELKSDYLDSNFYPRETVTDTMDMAIQRNEEMLEQMDKELERSIASLSRITRATSSKLHRNKQPIDTLAKRWGVSIPLAKETIKVTTQRGIRTTTGPITRRFRTRQKQLQIPILNTKVFTDTMFHGTESARGNNCAQLFVTDEGFCDGDPWPSKSDAYRSLNKFVRKWGVPRTLVSDNAGEETGGEWGRIVKEYLIPTQLTEPYSGWQNRCEDEIGEIKKHYTRIMGRHKCPKVFWCYGWQYTLELRQLLSRTAAGGRSPIETITGETRDISEYMDFDFYGWVTWRKLGGADEELMIGRWLGISHDVGSAMTYWILAPNGKILSRSTVRPMTVDDKVQFQKEMEEMDKMIQERFAGEDGETIEVINDDDTPNDEMEDPIRNHSQEKENEEDEDVFQGPDSFRGAEIFLPHGDRTEIAKVLGRKRNADGTFQGRAHKNPTLDSRIFTVRFPDGDEKDIAYNIIAEHLFSQVDEEGNQHHIFKGIINHRKKKSAVDKADAYRIDASGKKRMKKTTAGWDFQLQWADGHTSWVPLKELKETNAVEVAEYVVANRIDDEPAFKWWVKQVLKRKKRLIGLSKTRKVRKNYKFGIRIPRTIKEAMELDAEDPTGARLWYKALMKEMKNVMIAFEIKEKDYKPGPGYKPCELMMVFDLKMDFTRKARLVARGDLTNPPKTDTYSSVVTRESVRIAFLIAALNDLDVLMFDIGNAYLTAPAAEKLYVPSVGPEFGEYEGRPLIIKRALYGLKSSGAAYRNHFASRIREMGFEPCFADADVWRRKAVKDNGDKYYEYILTYVDDCLVISEHPRKIIDTLKTKYDYTIKDDEPPKRYLGATMSQVPLTDGTAWGMSAQQYLYEAIKEVERKWGKLEKLFSNRSSLDIPHVVGYHPELDQSRLLDDDEIQLYQSYVGILRWAVELGRIDLAHSAGVFARFSAFPREMHMVMILRQFAYCKKHLTGQIVFDPRKPDFSDLKMPDVDWKNYYPDIDGEPMPPRMPEPRGKSVRVTFWCDAAHATCHATRRSTTGIVFMLNSAPISWYSKRQNTIESSVFGSEFVSMKIAIEKNEALRYKLRMMGVPIDGPTYGFGDNQSVIKNSTLPNSTLQKKHNMVAYHKVRESCAMGAVVLFHEAGADNPSDALTKFLAKPTFVKHISVMMRPGERLQLEKEND